MDCGRCGTKVNPGFYTCPACGAERQKSSGCLGQVFYVLAMLLAILGIVPVALGFSENSHGYLLFGLVLWGMAFGIAWIVRKRTISYEWKLPPSHYLRRR